MANFDDRTPLPDTSAARLHLVVKLKERAPRESGGARLDSNAGIVSELRRAAPDAEFRPYFAEEKELRAANVRPFDRYIAAEVRDREAGERLARRLRELDVVEEAYVEGGPVPPPVSPLDDPRNANQGYLDAAPAGIDARWAWAHADGSGIRFVDLERGWTLNHEDLAAAGITIISGQSQDWHGHGTAVLGEVVAVDNQRGGIGIAPAATCRVVSQWRTSTTYNTAAAILSAGQSMSAGDVLLLEAQTTVGSQQRLPVEVETAVFDAIRHVVDDGIVVVEAAGNGGHDLDAFDDATNGHVLNRDSDDFRDSGAIMVGAASSAAPHRRLDFSCHGNRIDCYGWGENVDTTGDGSTGNATNTYTMGFSGTSSASPMVAGAAVLLQSWRRKRHNQVFDPGTMRSLLSSHINTASNDPPSDRIGRMPNLRRILEAQIEADRWRPIRENYLEMVYILFGLIDDAPGVIWVPGKGPVPVDPGWLPISRRIDAPQRDLIAGLAISEITRTISDEATRTKLSGAAVDAMRSAVERIGQRR